jgi:hypothetical protein
MLKILNLDLDFTTTTDITGIMAITITTTTMVDGSLLQMMYPTP